jgi:hypothetical protein
MRVFPIEGPFCAGFPAIKFGVGFPAVKKSAHKNERIEVYVNNRPKIPTLSSCSPYYCRNSNICSRYHCGW